MGINKSPHLKSSQKSIHWEPNCSVKTGRQEDANSLALFINLRTCLKMGSTYFSISNLESIIKYKPCKQ